MSAMLPEIKDGLGAFLFEARTRPGFGSVVDVPDRRYRLPMRLEGSCHCGRVRFSLESKEPWPYQRCYCSICRKTGGGGFMINLGGDKRSMKIKGKKHLDYYRAMIAREGKMVKSKHHRYFCRRCGCHLYAWHEKWPDLVHPVASAIDSPLPEPPAHVHMMLKSKANWVPVDAGPGDATYDAYPEKSLADWHHEHGYDDPR